MKKITVLALTALLSATVMADTPDKLDELLQEIRSDIDAQRLSSPQGNNALDKIAEFRAAAPFDYRVLPLAYDWGESYVALAVQARSQGNLGKAQGYLDKVWSVAALTPGLEDEQRALDQAFTKAGKDAVAVAAKKKADAEELARQRELAIAAEKEKKRLRIEAEKQRKLAAAQAAEKAKRDAAEKARRQEQERQRRAEQERQRQIATAEKQRNAVSSPATDLPIDIDDIALDAPSAVSVVSASKLRPTGANSPILATDQSDRLWTQAKEESKPLVEYTVPGDALKAKDRQIAEKIGDVCQRMVDEDASLVVHSANKADYRWLAVRLTICARRIDRSFRLRHSYQAADAGEPVLIALHPPRDSSLLRQVTQ